MNPELRLLESLNDLIHMQREITVEYSLQECSIDSALSGTWVAVLQKKELYFSMRDASFLAIYHSLEHGVIFDRIFPAEVVKSLKPALAREGHVATFAINKVLDHIGSTISDSTLPEREMEIIAELYAAFLQWYYELALREPGRTQLSTRRQRKQMRLAAYTNYVKQQYKSSKYYAEAQFAYNTLARAANPFFELREQAGPAGSPRNREWHKKYGDFAQHIDLTIMRLEIERCYDEQSALTSVANQIDCLEDHFIDGILQHSRLFPAVKEEEPALAREIHVVHFVLELLRQRWCGQSDQDSGMRLRHGTLEDSQKQLCAKLLANFLYYYFDMKILHLKDSKLTTEQRQKRLTFAVDLSPATISEVWHSEERAHWFKNRIEGERRRFRDGMFSNANFLPLVVPSAMLKAPIARDSATSASDALTLTARHVKLPSGHGALVTNAQRRSYNLF
ncbi:hypothetical protein OIV83_005654 [Microbotryomycetes sp. JL201]|nr:hypothetical protein OIV83_005654 [Microbotryomycetes sp. JL201]